MFKGGNNIKNITWMNLYSSEKTQGKNKITKIIKAFMYFQIERLPSIQVKFNWFYI
jgi:hypothetical protein